MLPSRLVTVDDTLWPTLEIWCLIYLTNFISSSHFATSNCRRISKWGWRWALWIHDQKPRVQLSEMACGTHSRTDTESGFTCFITLPHHYSPLQHSTHVPPSHSPEQWHTVTSHVFKFRASSLNGTWLVKEWPTAFLVPWVAKIRQLPSSCPSVRNTAAPTKMSFVKFDIGSFYEKLSRN